MTLSEPTGLWSEAEVAPETPWQPQATGRWTSGRASPRVPGASQRPPRWPYLGRLKTAGRWRQGQPPSVNLDRSPRRLPDRNETREGARARPRSEGPTALDLYMREVKEVGLLTPEEEVALARRVQAGDEQARERMIWANLRLVVKIARGYENLGLPLLDLINEGNIGLMKAVEHYDVSKGAKLSTYSSWWIRQSIRRALASQSTTVRLPVHAMDQICHLRRASRSLYELLGHEPTDEDLARFVGLPLCRVQELRDTPIRPASFDAPVGDEDSSTLAELVADERAEDPAQGCEERSSLGQLGEFIARLPQREATIIRARFGLDDGREKSLEEIGAWFHLTRERIRQLQNVALTKLRRMIEDPPAVPVCA